MAQVEETIMTNLGKDCEGQDIIPISDTQRLEFHTNRHPNTDGSLWGWVTGTTKNTVWSDENNRFNGDKAYNLVKEWNLKCNEVL